VEIRPDILRDRAHKKNGLSDRTDRRLSPLVLLIKSLDETARKHGLG